MHLFKISLFVFSLFIATFPRYANATADGPDYYQVRSSNSAILYESNDVNSKQLVTLPASTDGLKNLGCSGAPTYDQWSKMNDDERKQSKEHIWCNVSYQGRQGWIQNQYLQEGAAPSKPTFDCTQAAGEIEPIICHDADLISLDHHMESVFQDALKAAEGLDAGAKEAVKLLKANQRGWIKGRNDCWKADDKKACVIKEYTRRITFLQAKWLQLKPFKTVRYTCEINAKLVVSFIDTNYMPSMAIKLGDKHDAYILAPSGSGSRYEGSFGRFLWIKGDEATLLWEPLGQEMICQVSEL